MKTPTGPYRAARLAARRRAGSLEVEAAKRLSRDVTAYGRAVEAVIRTATPGNVDELVGILRAQSLGFAATVTSAVEQSRSVAFGDTLELWERAGSDVAAQVGIGRIRPAPLTLAGAFANLGGVPFQTALQFSAFTGAEEMGTIMRRAILDGSDAEELARRIRGYVTGSEPYKGFFELTKTATGEVYKFDLRKVPQHVRLGARKAVQNARRIAFSEIHNARAEAETQTFLRDPLIQAVQWELSPDRGVSFSPPDECDVLATADYFGLGPGRFPVDAVPGPPHPYDRCERVPITRSTRDVLKPKPSPPLRDGYTPRIPRGSTITPARARRIRGNAKRALDQTLMIRDEVRAAVGIAGTGPKITRGPAPVPLAPPVGIPAPLPAPDIPAYPRRS